MVLSADQIQILMIAVIRPLRSQRRSNRRL